MRYRRSNGYTVCAHDGFLTSFFAVVPGCLTPFDPADSAAHTARASILPHFSQKVCNGLPHLYDTAVDSKDAKRAAGGKRRKKGYNPVFVRGIRVARDPVIGGAAAKGLIVKACNYGEETES